MRGQPSRPSRLRWPIVLLLTLLTTAFVLYLRSSTRDEVPLSLRRHHEDCPFPQDRAKRVAIIGAGSGGSSAAYYLQRFAEGSPPIDITVYERDSHIGGRSTTVDAFDEPSEPVELGASIFVKVNHNLMHAVRRFGLPTQQGYGGGSKEKTKGVPEGIGIYDGDTWRYITPWDPTPGWWTAAKLLWQYGTQPLRVNSLMKETVGKFLRMYDEPVFPWLDLTSAIRDVELQDTVAVTGQTLFQIRDLNGPFSQEIVQASTRVNYATNLDTIHGVEAMVCMATDGAMSVEGGNWKIFDSMLMDSEANVRLETTVQSITKNDNNTYTVGSTGGSAMFSDQEVYDTVILASPFQFANLTITPAPKPPIPSIPYVELHVTLFASPYLLNPEAFHLEPGDKVPKIVLTTLQPNGKAPKSFYSISLLRPITNPATEQLEYLYKVFSPAPLEPALLRRLLASNEALLAAPTAADDPDLRDIISWRYDKVWHSYPVEHPRTVFENVKYEMEGGGEIWYPSSIEGFISTMETSSLSGKNVARLIYDEWIQEASNDAVKEASKEAAADGDARTRPSQDNVISEL